MSKRKKYKPKYKQHRPFLEDMFGARWARRIKAGSAASVLVLFFGGCALFLVKSQTLGAIGIAIGFYGALFWGQMRAAKDGDFEAVAIRWRRWLISAGLVLALIGVGVYFALSQITGLLLVTIAGLSLSVVVIGLAGGGDTGMDVTGGAGPPFGDVDPL